MGASARRIPTATSRAERIRVGVAGWDYKDWRGAFYPERAPRSFDPLQFLSRYVDLIEINSTFYRPAKREWAKRWAARVEEIDGVTFSAKLWRRFTHERAEAWDRDELNAAKEALYALQHRARLSALLAQFPWSFRNGEENLEWLADLRRAFARFPLVVEVRHESWNTPEFLEWLAEREIGFVNIDQPLFSNSMRPSARGTAHVGYVRVHGRNYRDWFRKGAGRDARYDYLYSPEELEPWVERTLEVAAQAEVDEVDVVFNNHYRAQAVVNAVQFQAMLGREATAPPSLFELYSAPLEAAGVVPAR